MRWSIAESNTGVALATQEQGTPHLFSGHIELNNSMQASRSSPLEVHVTPVLADGRVCPSTKRALHGVDLTEPAQNTLKLACPATVASAGVPHCGLTGTAQDPESGLLRLEYSVAACAACHEAWQALPANASAAASEVCRIVDVDGAQRGLGPGGLVYCAVRAINGAGAPSPTISAVYVVDTTAPSVAPFAALDLDCSCLRKFTMSHHWWGGLCVGHSCSDCELATWAEVAPDATELSVGAGVLNTSDVANGCVRVRYTDAHGHELPAAQPFTVDRTGPTLVGVTVTPDGMARYTHQHTLCGNLQTVWVSWASSDPESGVVAVRISINGTGVDQTVNHDALLPPARITIPLVVEGERYRLSVATQNGVGLWSHQALPLFRHTTEPTAACSANLAADTP
ncbi:uncharacterized protein MONBRDRAFT_5155 [Monosiga brevicollis MX1]|uniref:Uncharacterized protein n=1 Tax=Monosiga brevicollis TaxID=81824 RepID=A9UQ31_MONBE|nr:uncharacterized protein MONBRDRAFT_5155 [Monosiga brevicollis MX1]EDQ92525.1 predicted protein [Monosiga brevicollis MX1]|eukprot:XP_001742287.1 hypothetical protein [Monosiga brevicollis MX1]